MLRESRFKILDFRIRSKVRICDYFKISNLNSKISTFSRGFTMIELIVSVAIFAFMTALVIARYGSFNQGTLITNLAYDTALTIRTAQSYGLSVKSVDSNTNTFSASYGVHFDMSTPTQYVLFADKDNSGTYDSSEAITTYTLTSGGKISAICLGSTYSADCSGGTNVTGNNTLDITYKRPNPDSIFYCLATANVSDIANPLSCNNGSLVNPVTLPIAFITISSSDGTNNQIIFVRRNGQISVGN